MVSIIYDPVFLSHDTGYGHPERPERMKACVQALQNSSINDQLNWLEPRSVTREELLMVHSDHHIDQVKSVAESGGGFMDPDTPVSSRSYEAALFSAGAWLTGVDEVLMHKRSAYVISRPPGHHCERDQSMGFCLFSNCALSAHYALKNFDIQKVAVFDWDVHHGNGSQHILETDRRMAYCSTHQYPFYPGTGSDLEKGEYDNVLNIPLAAGSGHEEYMDAFHGKVLPFLKRVQPDILIISAGFDAARMDPLGDMNLDPEDFAHMTAHCREICPQLLLGLEGGYSLEALGQCSVAVAGALLD